MSIVREKLNTYYRIIEHDLSDAQTQKEYKLKKIYNELSVIASPSAFQLIITPEFGAISIAANQTIAINNFCFKDDIYITNAAGAGTAIIWLAGYKDAEC